MSNTNPSCAELKSASDLYPFFAPELHSCVEEAFFYEGELLQSGEMSFDQFQDLVEWFKERRDEAAAHFARVDELFDGVRKLVESGYLKRADQIHSLKQQLVQGSGSLLHRFITFQNLKSSEDAALSFLAWSHAKAMADLEDDFGVNLDFLRGARSPDDFGTSESGMTLRNFSIAA